ncbi:MAG: hypothetical protein ACYSU3_17850 [Planctomycetota bacterium]|jgi:hypothetical protein
MDYKNIYNLNDLFEHLRRREHWKEINPDIIKQIFKNSQSKVFDHPNEGIGVLKHFIFISEKYNLVANSYINISKDGAWDLGWILGLFSITLYRLGSELGKACCLAKTEDESEACGVFADASFMSSILCDPFNLISYYGMVILHGMTFRHRDVGLEFCMKYKRAEAELLNTPDNELTAFQLAEKQNLSRNPQELQGELKELEKLAPDLFPNGVLFDGMSLGNRISELEKELLKL